LFIAGLVLLIFELFTGGVGIAGGVGVLALVLGSYGLAVLPTNPVAVGLLVFAMFGFAVDVQTGVPRFWTGVGVLSLGVGSVLLYADGLDYLRVAEDRRWSGPGPFGSIGFDAEQVELPAVGPALYEPAGDGLGRRLAIHTATTDLFLESNLSRDDLFAIASTIGVEAAPLPARWSVVHAGALTAMPADPRASLRAMGLDVTSVSMPEGYVPVSATRSLERGADVGVTVTFRQDTDAAGPVQLHMGTMRERVIDTAPDPERVSIGTVTGRYSASGAELSWTDAGRSWSVQGDLALAQLVAIASSVVGARR